METAKVYRVTCIMDFISSNRGMLFLVGDKYAVTSSREDMNDNHVCLIYDLDTRSSVAWLTIKEIDTYFDLYEASVERNLLLQ